MLKRARHKTSASGAVYINERLEVGESLRSNTQCHCRIERNCVWGAGVMKLQRCAAAKV
jgi:hypothetical protein